MGSGGGGGGYGGVGGNDVSTPPPSNRQPARQTDTEGKSEALQRKLEKKNYIHFFI